VSNVNNLRLVRSQYPEVKTKQDSNIVTEGDIKGEVLAMGKRTKHQQNSKLSTRPTVGRAQKHLNNFRRWFRDIIVGVAIGIDKQLLARFA